jgi:hypothetical protein
MPVRKASPATNEHEQVASDVKPPMTSVVMAATVGYLLVMMLVTGR